MTNPSQLSFFDQTHEDLPLINGTPQRAATATVSLPRPRVETSPLINYQPSDVDRQLAIRAHSHTSHVPEKRADQVIAAYVADMKAMAEQFALFVTSDNEAEMREDLGNYKAGYLSKLSSHLAAHSRVASAFITGPSNFPTERNRKRGDTADRRRDELLDFQMKTKLRLNRKYNPAVIAAAPISSDDDDAISRLQAKIDKAEALQATMKAANKIIRKKKLLPEAKVAALIELDGISEKTAWELLEKDFASRVGFPSYRLTNNNANIRRMRSRIADLQAEVARGEVEDYEATINGTQATVSENRETNRLQLFFDGKPSAEIRKLVKSYGFNWSPTQGAWQRKLNDNARRTVEIIKD